MLCCENLSLDEEIYIHVESVYWANLEGHEKCSGGFLIYLNFKRCQMLKSFLKEIIYNLTKKKRNNLQKMA